MQNEFEKLGTVEEMFAYLAGSGEEETPSNDLVGELQLLSVQTFLKLFGRYKEMNGTERDELEQSAEVFNNTESNPMLRRMALYKICTLLFPEDAPKKDIARKNDKVYQTPCEDCGATPTHLIVFSAENRTEEHFLCEECEEAARSEEDDE